MTQLTLVARSSSHFSRTARLFALELAVEHRFQPVLDLTTLDTKSYADNPAMKVPILIDEQGPLYGTENICRELVRRSGRNDVVLRGDVGARVVSNAEELVVSAMSSGVAIILSKASGATPVAPKLLASIQNSLTFVETNLDRALAALPQSRSLSFLEVTLFCLVRHLPFRQVLAVDAWPRLLVFADGFGQRESARATEYRFDAA